MERELLNTKLVREILSLVLSGSYGLGKRLPSERKLCDMYGVSRGTVRQALADLENLGIVEIRHGSGVYVRNQSITELPEDVMPPEFDSVSLDDILSARKVIESACIKIACRRSGEKLIQRLEEIIDAMVENMDNLPEFIKYDMEFHETVINSCGNPALIIAYKSISEYHRYSQIFTSLHEGEEEVAIDYHQRMLYALKKKNPELGERAIVAHLDHLAGIRVKK
jgi:GntR family transcriptional regulator, transcriptional repressor for pyruvate dehydrogenase complex